MNCVASYTPWAQYSRLWASRLDPTLPNRAYALGGVRVSEAEQAMLAAAGSGQRALRAPVVPSYACTSWRDTTK